MGVEKVTNWEEGAAALKEWLTTQPHLPQNIRKYHLNKFETSFKISRLVG